MSFLPLRPDTNSYELRNFDFKFGRHLLTHLVPLLSIMLATLLACMGSLINRNEIPEGSVEH